MRPTLHIVKIGGQLINDRSTLAEFLDIFTKIPGDKLLVHGGGRKATELSALLGIETRMIEGRRITDRDTLEVAIMVYAGLINKNIVAELQARGQRSLGITGADGDVIRAHKRTMGDIDYGYVGDIDQVRADVITSWLGQNIIPVCAPITHDGHGQLLNTNADTIASRLAVACTARYDVELSYCFEYPGVLYDMSTPHLTMSTLTEGELINLKSTGSISSGMIPKLANGFDALKGGVHKVHVCGISNLLDKLGATELSK